MRLHKYDKLGGKEKNKEIKENPENQVALPNFVDKRIKKPSQMPPVLKRPAYG